MIDNSVVIDIFQIGLLDYWIIGLNDFPIIQNPLIPKSALSYGILF